MAILIYIIGIKWLLLATEADERPNGAKGVLRLQMSVSVMPRSASPGGGGGGVLSLPPPSQPESHKAHKDG